VTNPVFQIAKHPFTVQLLPFIVEINPLEMSGAGNFAFPHSADKDIVFPVGKFVASVEGHAGNGNRRDPEYERRLHSLLPWFLRHTRPEIEASKTDDGPSIVLAGLQDVDLVAAVRAV